MSNPAPAAPSTPRSRRIREVAVLYGITLLVTGGLTWLQGSVGWLRGYLLVIVAATFLYLPIEVLHRQGIDPAALGIHRRGLARALKLALIVMAITFPAYLVGFHFWQTEWLGREARPAAARFDRWPVELEEAPRLESPRAGEVWLFTADDRIWLRWHLPAGQTLVGVITGTGLEARGGAVRLDEGRLRIDAGSDGHAIFAADTDFTLTLDAGGDRLPAERLRLGTALSPAEAMPFRAERGPWWLLNLILVQLLLVALPEEVFYRGYLQTRLDGLVGRDVKILGVMVNPASLVLTSALFAAGHFLTIPHPQRLAVFFPSLLFGWMRRASGGVAAGVFYHAACNIVVDIAGGFYFG